MTRPEPRTGIVVDAQGTPVEGALVSVAESEGPVPEIALRTGSDGRFRVPLPPGRALLRAYAPDGTAGSAEAQGGAGEEIVIRLETG